MSLKLLRKYTGRNVFQTPLNTSAGLIIIKIIQTLNNDEKWRGFFFFLFIIVITILNLRLFVHFTYTLIRCSTNCDHQTKNNCNETL